MDVAEPDEAVQLGVAGRTIPRRRRLPPPLVELAGKFLGLHQIASALGVELFVGNRSFRSAGSGFGPRRTQPFEAQLQRLYGATPRDLQF